MAHPAGSPIYRALLRILPLRFRVAYADEMEELFCEALRVRRRRGWAPWLATWVRATADVAVMAVRLRLAPEPGERLKSEREGVLGAGIRDVHFAFRSLRRRPLFTTVSILTLGLGIAGTTTMFSMVNGVLLERLPFDEPDRLVAIWQTVPFMRGQPGDDGARWDRTRLTYVQYRDLSESTAVFTGLAAYRAGAPDVATLTGIGDPVELPAGAASASLLPLLGVRPILGRWFLPEEESSRAGNDGASVAVISHELWMGRFDGAPGTVGRTVTLDDHPFTVVGILPPGFRLTWISASVAGEGDPPGRDLWFPIGAPGWIAHNQGYSWEVVGRLAPGVAVDQALAATQAIIAAHQHSSGDARVLSRGPEEKRGLAPPLILLFAATTLLLFIACGNIATLATAEVQGRRREIATRFAMGAGSARIARLLLTESLLLAMLGSLLGVFLARGGVEILVALSPPIPRLSEVAVDFRVVGFATVLGVGTALLFGGGPSLWASRGPASPLLTGSTRTSQSNRSLSRLVMGAEVALTVMLLVAGGLLTQSLIRLLDIDPGFDPRGLAAVEVRLPPSRYDRESTPTFFQEALSRLEAIPGIGSVSAVSRLPFPGNTSAMNLRVDDRTYSPLFYQVGPRYFETLGVPLLAGRTLDGMDGPDGPLAIVVNEVAARRFWPDGSPIGSQVSLSFPSGPVTVVGVVRNMKRQFLTAEAEPAFFIPFSRVPDETVWFVARTHLEVREPLPLMREAVTSVDRDLVVRSETTVSALVEESANHERFRALLMNAFGFLATLLAAAGVIGVTARSVAFRTRELGIKMALGARGPGLVADTVRENLVVGLIGTGIGLGGALWVTRLLSTFLFGIQTWDPRTYGVVSALALAVCGLASYVPARRISGLDPLEVLNGD